MGEIGDYYTFLYLLSECGLVSGILLLSLTQPVIKVLPINKLFIRRLKIGIILTFGIFTAATLIIYIVRGVPILLVSRADASLGGSGFGFVTRISQTANLLFVLFYFAKKKASLESNSKFEYLMFGITILFNFLSGFKAFFLLYLFGYFVTHGKPIVMGWKKDFYAIIIGTVIILLLFSLVLQTTNLEEALLGLFARILSSGDVYFMAFPNNIIEQLPPQNFIYQLFGSLLASFRIIDWDQAPLNYGYVINAVISGQESSFGPTFRYNVLWYLLTKSIALTTILSFVVGILIGSLNRSLNRFSSLNFSFVAIAVIYYSSFVFILSPDAAISTIFMTLLIGGMIYATIFLLAPKNRIRKILP